MMTTSLRHPTPNASRAVPVRVLIIPGLRDSGEGHWQTWLQDQYADAARVQQQDWERADLQAWSAQIDKTLARHDPRTRWIAVAHSFGCLGLVHHIERRRRASASLDGGGIQAALMVAPADPVKFSLVDRLPQHSLNLHAMLLGSENDPWMPLYRAEEWADKWDVPLHNLGKVGHINTESGFGPWPLARLTVDRMIRAQRSVYVDRETAAA